MLRKYGVLWVVGFIAALASPAAAAWISGKESNAFDGDLFYAYNGSFASGTGFNCRKEDGVANLLYIVPDKVEEQATQALNSARGDLELVAIVDHDPRVTFKAGYDLNASGTNYRIRTSAEGVLALMKKLRDATQRFAVGLSMGGKVLEQETFDVDGSGAAIRYMIKNCELDGASSGEAPSAGKKSDDKPGDATAK